MRALKAALPGHLPMLAELIAIPTVSAADPRLDQPNRPALERLAEWAESIGFEVHLQPSPDGPGCAHPGGKANLIATLGPSEGIDAGLLLSGHADTVPYDEGAWSSDPFELVEREGKLYGLGAADMKGFFVAGLHAASRFRAETLSAPLILVATADEESSMAGARALLEAGRPRATRAIIGEPTGLRPVHVHKGILMERLRVVGRSGHSSDPSLGASALEGMAAVIHALLDYRNELQAIYRDSRFAVPTPTMNFGRIRGGDSANRICGMCELDLDLRALPQMPIEEVREELRRRAREALAGRGLTLELPSIALEVPAFATPDDAELVRVCEEMTGVRSRAVPFCT